MALSMDVELREAAQGHEGHFDEPCEDGRPPKSRRRLLLVAFCIGFGQGCGLCFFVGSGSYFSARFSNPRFFIVACALFYIPPVLVTMSQLLVDHLFDARFGVRPAIRCRVLFSSVAMVVLYVALAHLVGTAASPGQERVVLGLGVALGVCAAALFGAANSLFGAVDPRSVPYVVLGQTAAGVYTNAAAYVLGFSPGCRSDKARAYFLLAAGTIFFIAAVYQVLHLMGVLEKVYRHHEELLQRSLSRGGLWSPNSSPMMSRAGSLNFATEALRTCLTPPPNTLAAGPATEGRCARRGPLGFPAISWIMALCQTVAIAGNMSLTPLSNQIAHDNYALSQEVVLTKLLADFVGRSAYLLMPSPRRSARFRWRSCWVQAILAWAVELLRFPLWLFVYSRAKGAATAEFLSNNFVLIGMFWLPLISSGAFSSSWCMVVASTAAPEDRKRAVPLLMTSSIYMGFSIGIVSALQSA